MRSGAAGQTRNSGEMRALLVPLGAVAAALAALFGDMVAAVGELSEGARAAREARAKNHDVCYQIAGSWWGTREAQKTRAQITAADAVCDVWTNQPEQCNSVTARVGMTGYTIQELTMPCTTVGAHDKRCVSNPCNSYNTGSCTLQSTAGQCVWFEGEALTKYNAFLAANGETPLATHGCYRNRCNLPGLGKQTAACPGRSVPGLFECTWCTGAGDAVLDGLGVGCQMTVPTTTAICAPVNSPNVPKAAVMMNTANNRCQCDARFPFCAQQVAEQRGTWKHRY